MVWSQQGAFLGSPWGRIVAVVTCALEFIALGVQTMIKPAKEERPLSLRTTESPRSAYEEQIRQAAAQEERNRLARDLHDSIKQQIFAIQTGAAAAEARMESDEPGARQALGGVRSAAREAMVEMEAMLDQLRAAPLESVGLVEALKKQCEALQYRTGAKVEVSLGAMPEAGRLPPGAAQSLFRIAQEALANVARHARATEVRVRLAAEGEDCMLTIGDNGSGFTDDGSGTGLGLANMRSRAAEHGGRMSVRSTTGSGTEIVASVPLATPKEDARLLLKQTVVGFLFAAAFGAGAGIVGHGWNYLSALIALSFGTFAVRHLTRWAKA
jgi:signal transduction histidine kinase